MTASLVDRPADTDMEVSVRLRRLEREVAAGAQCARRDTEEWYPVRGEGHAVGAKVIAEARAHAWALCAGCPVRRRCLELSLLVPAGRHGIWGGMVARDRQAMLRARRRARTAQELLAAQAAAAGAVA